MQKFLLQVKTTRKKYISASVTGIHKEKLGYSHALFEIISLESQQKCWHRHFSEKEKKGCFCTDFLKICLYVGKSKHIYQIKDLKTTW